MTAKRTQPPLANAAFADAENVRIRSAGFSAVQRISLLRTFEGVESGKIQTVLSLQTGATFEERDKPVVVVHEKNDRFLRFITVAKCSESRKRGASLQE